MSLTILEKMAKVYQGKGIKDYKLLEELGYFSSGRVWKVADKHSGDVFAIKELKRDLGLTSWKYSIHLREVKTHRDLNHPNIVRLKRLIKENDVLYLVTECMDMTLKQVMENREKKPFDNNEVRNIAAQLFQALAYMHGRRYFHRDLKPNNILVSKDVVKIANLCSAREVSRNYEEDWYTEQVTTLWYMAPELLLLSWSYNPAVDMWAMGAIMSELFTSTPLFQGETDIDQISKICSVIGTPTKETWEDGLQLGKEIRTFEFPKEYEGADELAKLVPNADEDAMSLIRWLCSWDHWKRPTATEALQHPFFASHYTVPKSIATCSPKLKAPSPAKRRKLESVKESTQ
ncbi:hypothetical protein Syun_018519 [Stephania yunnanensis]|uniref:Protein kinase domain-containing protein n=1 Tax=Stephania yunnanensis TaxID=152371 RepID=A0AAP0IUA8_9MAGN